MISYKVAVIGNYSVGKSNLLYYMLRGVRNELDSPTIGAAFLRKTVQRRGKSLTLEYWDSGGSERFRSLIPIYLKKVHILLIVFDRHEPNSFQDITSFWPSFIDQHMTSGFMASETIIFLVENKVDLPDDFGISERAQKFANEKGYIYHQTSAKTGFGTSQLLEKMVDQILERADLPSPPSKIFEPIQLVTTSDESTFSKCGEFMSCN